MIPLDHARALLGQQVKVTMEGGDSPVIATGKLLMLADSGEFVVEDDMGFVHYGWPWLNIEPLNGEPMIRKAPRIRIASQGHAGGTAVEVITQHGTVVDISNMVTRVIWSLDGHKGLAEVQLFLSPHAEVEVLGDLTDVKVET